MKQPETFEELILSCGYDVSKPLNVHEQQVVNVAGAVWRHCQHEIAKIEYRIADFKHALKSL